MAEQGGGINRWNFFFRYFRLGAHCGGGIATLAIAYQGEEGGGLATGSSCGVTRYYPWLLWVIFAGQQGDICWAAG